MPDQICWWTFDAQTQTLLNRASGQRVRFDGAVADAGTLLRRPASGPTRMRFSYEDAEVRYPLLVTSRSESYGSPGYDHRDRGRQSLSWSIDHVASAEQWRRSSGIDAEIPPYGLWRRVDDALFDALACWPPTEATGPEPSRIDAWGGWVNGTWSPRLRRSVGRTTATAPTASGC